MSSLNEPIKPAPIFGKNETAREITFVLDRGINIQIAKKGGGELFKTYDGEWIVAFLVGNEVIHSMHNHYTLNPVQHYMAAMSYAGWLNHYTKEIPAKYHSIVDDFWRGKANFVTFT